MPGKRLPLIDGYPQLRVRRVKATKRRAEHLIVKCGCCSNTVHIYPSDPIGADIGMEINGVLGAVRDWREILLPLLKARKETGEKP
jgi:hypothetical protein